MDELLREPGQDEHARLPYHPPTMVDYGPVVALTQGDV